MDDNTVMLSEAKHLDGPRDRPFAEFTLSGSEGLRVTVEVPISSSVVFFESPLSALGGLTTIQMKKLICTLRPNIHSLSLPSFFLSGEWPLCRSWCMRRGW
jgi:hypothetical protein